MAITGNSSDKQVQAEIKYYTGVCSVKVDAVCPNLDETTKLGYNFQKEPEYLTDKEGVKGVRLDFYVSNNILRSKISIFLKNELNVSKTKGTKQFINKFATTTWSNTLEEATGKEAKNGKKWFLPDGARQAFVGEEQLYELLRNWLNVKIGDELQLTNFKKLFTGDFSELQTLLKSFNSNVFKVLATVNTTDDGKTYQQINNNMFDRATSSTPKRFIDYVETQKKAGYPIKEAFSIDFKQYIPVYKETAPDADPTAEQPKSDFSF